jgi:hypothetical protein
MLLQIERDLTMSSAISRWMSGLNYHGRTVKPFTFNSWLKRMKQQLLGQYYSIKPKHLQPVK